MYIYGQSSDEGTMGKLTAASSTRDAAIGSLQENHAGIIEINGGNINTSMTGAGSCIGSGAYRGGYHITINGGKVTATNTKGVGAAIGSGTRTNMNYSQGSVHSITINGGVVNATVSSNDGAAIGGGLYFSGGDITITGGTVVAKSSSRGAAIGGGSRGNGGNITITGGNVTAESSASVRATPAIGSGYDAGNIFISGGTVTATSKKGSGIGVGYNGNNGSIAIVGGTVSATGGSRYGNINAGASGSTMLLDGTTVTVSGHVRSLLITPFPRAQHSAFPAVRA